jgi:transcriptional regulator with XRE-family HTH domain/quercetin dioxygenase-like cupin family protein
MPETDIQQVCVIGEKLRAMRKKQQMSLRELASRANVSASMLSQIETGKAYPSVRSIYSIAAALAVPVDYFFPGQESGNSVAFESTTNVASEMTASEMREARVNQVTDVASMGFAFHPQSPIPVVHSGARPTIELQGGVKWSRLTALAESGAEFLEITYAPGAASGTHRSHHEGREFGLILEGELIVELGFEVYILRSGDSIIFDSTTTHRLTNQNTKPLRALWVVLNQT